MRKRLQSILSMSTQKMLLEKNNFFYWGLFFCLLFIGVSCRGTLNDDLDFIEDSNVQTITTQIGVEELPAAIQSYIAMHYAQALIHKTLRYQHDKSTSYGIFLQSGEFLLFAPNGQLLAIDRDGIEENMDRDGQEILAGDLPVLILQYILENYPNAVILFTEKETDGYEIYLDNNIELHFDEVGNFLDEQQDDDDDGSSSSSDDDDDDNSNNSDDDDDGDNSSTDDDDG